MQGRTFLAGLVAWLVWPAWAHAQAVQLPTFHYFTVNTSVSVPDRGGAVLGGVNRAAVSATERGVPLVGKLPGASPLFRQRGLGQQLGAHQAHVTATIIDLAEMDRAVLAQAAAERAGGEYAAGDGLLPRAGSMYDRAPSKTAAEMAVQRRAEFIARNVSRNRVAESP